VRRKKELAEFISRRPPLKPVGKPAPQKPICRPIRQKEGEFSNKELGRKYAIEAFTLIAIFIIIIATLIIG